MSDYDPNSWANRKSANNDGMDPDWRPPIGQFEIEQSAKPPVMQEPEPCYACTCGLEFREPEARTMHAIDCGHHLLKVSYESQTLVLRKHIDELAKLYLEIDTRWRPALAKMTKERDGFQYEMMKQREMLVESRELLRLEKMAHGSVDSLFRKSQDVIEKMEKQLDDARAENEKLMTMDYWQQRYKDEAVKCKLLAERIRHFEEKRNRPPWD